MAQLNNFYDNPNIKMIEQDKYQMFQIIEHQADLSLSQSEAAAAYFSMQMNVKRRQGLINLNGQNSAILSRGAMQWILGNVQVQNNVKGAGDFFGKVVASKVTGESAIKPLYSGVGIISLEPTFKHLLLEDIANWQGGIVMDDGLFLACDGRLQQKVYKKSFSGALSESFSGKNGTGGLINNMFNLSLMGQAGTILLESPVSRNEIIEVYLNNETLTVDGDLVIAWSPSINMTCQPLMKRSLLGSGVSGEGFVNIFTGTGKILLAPTI